MFMLAHLNDQIYVITEREERTFSFLNLTYIKGYGAISLLFDTSGTVKDRDYLCYELKQRYNIDALLLADPGTEFRVYIFFINRRSSFSNERILSLLNSMDSY
jgi:hypothetical protein